MSAYKTCAVPMCKSTTIKNPDKLFIHVPKCVKRRKQWIQLARRNPDLTSNNTTMYFCEDHFDLPNDMENYTEYKIMGSVSQIRMRQNCLPSKFECQPDRLKRMATITPPQHRSVGIKRQRKAIIESIFEETQQPSSSGSASEVIVDNNEMLITREKAIQVYPDRTNVAVQVSIKAQYRSRAQQTQVIHTKNKNMSPMKTHVTSVATSPLKSKIKKKILFKSGKLLEESPSRSSIISEQSVMKTDSSPSIKSLQFSISDCHSCDLDTQHELSEIQRKIEIENLNRISLENTKRLIKKNPKFYIGVPEDCYYLIEIIQKHIKISEVHLLLCLKKIRQDLTFLELGDQFGMSLFNASKIFMKYLPLVANALRPFIIKASKTAVKQNLPMAFRHKYHETYCLIDCLEIEIEKPSEAVYQALTWSEYKKANTAKYLISSTPDGIINYISPGYGGRITDVLLVESCDLLEHLEPGVSILADRGFKHLEQVLTKKGFNLIRPPSVSLNSKLSRNEVKKTKEVASLRIHIERVIRRVREFALLKPHSVVNRKLLKYLDDCVVIACSLINLQNSLIKNT